METIKDLDRTDLIRLLSKAYDYLLMYQDFREHVKSFDEFVEKLHNNTL